MDQFKGFEIAVSNLNHELQKLKKEHKEEKKQLLKQLEEMRDREVIYQTQIEEQQLTIDNFKRIIDNLEFQIQDMCSKGIMGSPVVENDKPASNNDLLSPLNFNKLAINSYGKVHASKVHEQSQDKKSYYEDCRVSLRKSNKVLAAACRGSTGSNGQSSTGAKESVNTDYSDSN